MPELPRIIALYSPVPQSGKTTVAKYLMDRYGYQRIPFAQPLKDMLISLLISCGFTYAQALYYQENKEVIIPGLEVTFRELAAKLGTEWGRVQIASDFWVRIWRMREQTLGSLYPKKPIVVDDMRFPNEFGWLQAFGATLIHIQRQSAVFQSAPSTLQHSSEGGLSDRTFDHYVVNNGTFEELYAQIDSCLSAPVPA